MVGVLDASCGLGRGSCSGFRSIDVPDDAKGLPVGLHLLEEYVAPGMERDVIEAAKESMNLHHAYFGAMAHAMSHAS